MNWGVFNAIIAAYLIINQRFIKWPLCNDYYYDGTPGNCVAFDSERFAKLMHSGQVVKVEVDEYLKPEGK